MTVQENEESCDAYHHGDLRNALIVAAGELIEERGGSDFAMIDAARRAGVSSAAPYRHFKDKEALLAAVCQVCFLALSEEVAAEATKHEPGSRTGLIAIGKSYMGFVGRHPQFYDLMWGDRAALAMDTFEPRAQHTGFHLLVESVAAWAEKEQAEIDDPARVATELWALVQGLAGLKLHGHIDHFTPDLDVYALLESAATTLLDGMPKRQLRSGRTRGCD